MSDCQVVVSRIPNVVIQNDVHDASQAQFDNELDVVTTESLNDVDVNKFAPSVYSACMRGHAYRRRQAGY